MNLAGRLSIVELEIVMHIANGKTREEIAAILHRSPANIDYHLGRARRRCKANNLPHLVSIAIASGDLVWEDERRMLNGHVHT